MKRNRVLIACLCLLLAIISIFGFIGKTIKVYATDDDFDVKSYCLIDANTGNVLREKNSTDKLEVASMVKLMTSLLTMEKIERGEWTLDTTLQVSEYAASMEGSQAFLDAGKEYKLDDLLKSVIVASANDSSVVLAEGYAGTENAFVEIMNKRAKELGMTDTLYGNATGLPALNQYSTARDIAKLLNVVSTHELYHKYSTIWMDNLVHESGRITELVNTNRLIKYYPGCECGKTGFTDEAGYCLSVSAKRNDMRLISVVMGARSSSDRFSISSSLLNYGFSNFKSVKIVDSTVVIPTTTKIKGSKNVVECVPEKDLFVVQKCGAENNDYTTKTEFEKIKAPIKKGDIIGTISVVLNDEVVCKTNLVATDDFISPTYFDIMGEIFENWAI
jgi:D-alanyl-D-alanine carboxypeptidase (penicillin-binding protein 5/6)